MIIFVTLPSLLNYRLPQRLQPEQQQPHVLVQPTIQRGHPMCLLFVISRFVVDDGEVSQLVRVLVASDHVKVVAKLLLLQVLLRQVLQVTLRERRLGSHSDARLFNT